MHENWTLKFNYTVKLVFFANKTTVKETLSIISREGSPLSRLSFNLAGLLTCSSFGLRHWGDVNLLRGS